MITFIKNYGSLISVNLLIDSTSSLFAFTYIRFGLTSLRQYLTRQLASLKIPKILYILPRQQTCNHYSVVQVAGNILLLDMCYTNSRL